MGVAPHRWKPELGWKSRSPSCARLFPPHHGLTGPTATVTLAARELIQRHPTLRLPKRFLQSSPGPFVLECSITKYHRQGGSHCTAPQALSPNSRCRQDGFLLQPVGWAVGSILCVLRQPLLSACRQGMREKRGKEEGGWGLQLSSRGPTNPLLGSLCTNKSQS